MLCQGTVICKYACFGSLFSTCNLCVQRSCNFSSRSTICEIFSKLGIAFQCSQQRPIIYNILIPINSCQCTIYNSTFEDLEEPT